MSNVYEERLGTDRMLPLVFRMALPAVAAQIVNLLYNLVDRIYIGHIPVIGTDALAGIGVRRWPPSRWGRVTVCVPGKSWAMALLFC